AGLAAIIQALRRVEPELAITVLSARPEETAREYNVAAVSRTGVREIRRAIAAADLLISGGGSLLQDVTGNRTIPYYLGVVWLAQLLGKPVFFYAQGVGPVRKWPGKLLVRKIVNRVDAITVRDKESAAELRRLGVTQPPVTVTADPVFGLEIPGREVSGPAGPVIGVAARECPDAGDFEYKTVIARACAQLVERHGARILLLPFHQPADLPVARELQALIGPGARVAGEGLPPLELAGVVAGLDFLLGMRLHALIFATLGGVPFAGIAYDPKVTALLALFGQKPVLGGGIHQVGRHGGSHFDETQDVAEIVRRWEAREEIRQKALEVVHGPGGLRDAALATARMALATIWTPA
ncbi:MAG: polysaccharide pyruvyl transferase CsaB, partial [Firmicutes bacterium]|nr:polysaccharide pyruvyl transferase CsaB [Bacillota bacterium]